ncbi:xanthotoxin 5-hydroxylase CYP82C4-like [Manihot esculenta]|uniref:xanthotoxin 5-hydroxylase CYP82C4-like n=1 Tax=Manihot esculenta TaxID=3983 RepID=UPI001CC43988|nr:xanthotoxin 5-hydroxylase CYP82C4-like [Manihot esculenta]
MDFSSNLIAILGVVALLLLRNLWRAKNKKKIKGKLVPEAPGGLPIIGHLHQLGGKKSLARTLGEMADKYGSIFSLRLGVHRSVIITDHQAMKDCFTTNDKLFASRPHSIQAIHVGYDYASIGFAPYGTYWRNMRKLATIELLSSHRAKILNYVQISEVNYLVKDLYLHYKNNANAKINMSERIEHLILNMVTRMVAGKRFFDDNKEARSESGRPIGEIIREYMFVTGALVPGDLIPFLGWLDIGGIVKTMKRVTKEVDVIVESWIEEHKKKTENEAKKDFIDVMLSVVEDEPSMKLKRETIIKATTTAIILAGSDTTAITTIWALSSLVNNRQALERAQQEIDEKIGRDRCVQVSDVDKLEYLSAIIKETLRLYPPGPLGVPREAAEDCFISGYFIPKGTRIFTHLWKLHRDPKVWKDPEAFIPERFLTTNANLDVTGQNFEYLPFSAGRRSCPGMNLAMQVLHLTLARLIQAFDLKTPANEPVDMTEAQGIVMPRLTPLEIVVVPRLDPEFYERE